jgi:hypothetical protein
MGYPESSQRLSTIALMTPLPLWPGWKVVVRCEPVNAQFPPSALAWPTMGTFRRNVIHCTYLSGSVFCICGLYYTAQRQWPVI